MQILSHFLCCIGFFFRKNFTVQYHGFEKLYCVMMSRDMYRGDLRLALLGIWFKKLSNHANNIFCMYTSSKNDIIIFHTQNYYICIRYIAWILVYQMCPVIIFNFCLFLGRSVWYNSKQCQMFLTKKSVGGFCPVSLDIVRLDI